MNVSDPSLLRHPWPHGPICSLNPCTSLTAGVKVWELPPWLPLWPVLLCCLHIQWPQEAVPVLEPRPTEEPSCPCRGCQVSAGGQAGGSCTRRLVTARLCYQKTVHCTQLFSCLVHRPSEPRASSALSATLFWGWKAGKARGDLSRSHSAVCQARSPPTGACAEGPASPPAGPLPHHHIGPQWLWRTVGAQLRFQRRGSDGQVWGSPSSPSLTARTPSGSAIL